MDVADLRPIEHEEPGPAPGSPVGFLTALAAIGTYAGLRGWIPLEAMFVVGGATCVGYIVRCWRMARLPAHVPRAAVLPRHESAMDELVDAIVRSAVDGDAARIRFRDLRDAIGVLFDGVAPTGPREAMLVPKALERPLVDELARRARGAGADGYVTTIARSGLPDRAAPPTAVRSSIAGGHTVHLHIAVHGEADDLATIEIVRLGS